MRSYLFVGVENYVFSRLHPRRQTTSPLLPSTIHHSIPQSIEMQWFLVDFPGDDGSPPPLSHPNSVHCHSLLRSAKPSARREEAPARLTQLLPFLSSPSRLNLFLCPLPHTISSASPTPSPLPPTPTPTSLALSHSPSPSKVLYYSSSSRVGVLVQANTTLWLYGTIFALAVTKNMIQTNTGAVKPSNPSIVTKVPSVREISCPNSQGALILFSRII